MMLAQTNVQLGQQRLAAYAVWDAYTIVRRGIVVLWAFSYLSTCGASKRSAHSHNQPAANMRENKQTTAINKLHMQKAAVLAASCRWLEVQQMQPRSQIDWCARMACRNTSDSNNNVDSKHSVVLSHHVIIIRFCFLPYLDICIFTVLYRHVDLHTQQAASGHSTHRQRFGPKPILRHICPFPPKNPRAKASSCPPTKTATPSATTSIVLGSTQLPTPHNTQTHTCQPHS